MRTRLVRMATISLRQWGMILVCFGMCLFVGVSVGDVILSIMAAWLCSSGRTPREVWHALLER